MNAVAMADLPTPTWRSECGRASLYLGDCCDILKSLPRQCAQAVVTDPPYAIVNRFGSVRTSAKGGRRSLQFAWDGDYTFQVVADGVACSLECLADDGAAFVFCGFDTVTPNQCIMREHGLIPKPYAWVKSCPPPPAPGSWWPSGFEVGVYAYRPGAWFGDRNPSCRNVFECDTYRHGQPGKVDHPAQKPIKLMRHLCSTMAPVDSCILDSFLGSGTTGVACAQLGRKFIGIEIEPKYFEIAKTRIDQELRQGRMFA